MSSGNAIIYGLKHHFDSKLQHVQVKGTKFDYWADYTLRITDYWADDTLRMTDYWADDTLRITDYWADDTLRITDRSFLS